MSAVSKLKRMMQTGRSDTLLVVPSIRKESFERFCEEWKPTGLFNGVDLCLIEDNPTKMFKIPDDLWAVDGFAEHFCWADIDYYDWSWIIPRRSDTVRSFGYWHAWEQGYEYLLTLDDDCYPSNDYNNIVNSHKNMLDGRTRWFNTLNNTTPRGVPYKNLGASRVHVNHGLWQGVLDYDAPHQLVDPKPEVYTHDNRIVPRGAYFPFCGMNVMWRREAFVLSYHLLMGRNVTWIPYPFDRFGDIWSGIIAKKICDHLGWSMSTGTPYIHHDRASNPFANLRKEANGIEVNEYFWERIDAVDLSGADTAAGCYKLVADAISEFGGEHDKYWKELGDAMRTWADLFRAP